jgi:hypothetical protein
MATHLKDLSDLRQRDVEVYYRALREIAAEMGASLGMLMAPEYNGIVVRAAVRAGWLEGGPGDVADMTPRVVKELATEINKAIADAYEIPGE